MCGDTKDHAAIESFWRERVYKKIEETDCKLIGFAAGRIKGKSKLTLQCEKCLHIWSSTRLSEFVLKNRRCQRCSNRENKTRPDKELADKLLAEGNFVEGTTIERSERLTLQGHRSYWWVTCPICANDEFSKAGLCDGTFEVYSGSIQSGIKGCRCSNYFKYSKEQREFQVKKLLQEKEGISFVGWLDDYTSTTSKLVFNCDTHGKYTKSVNNVINGKYIDCPICRPRGFRPYEQGSLYVIVASSVTHDFTGYGISNNVTARLRQHVLALSREGFTVSKLCIFQGDGELVAETESKVKRHFELFPQQVGGFKEEATYCNEYDSVIKFVERDLSMLCRHDFDNTNNTIQDYFNQTVTDARLSAMERVGEIY